MVEYVKRAKWAKWVSGAPKRQVGQVDQVGGSSGVKPLAPHVGEVPTGSNEVGGEWGSNESNGSSGWLVVG